MSYNIAYDYVINNDMLFENMNTSRKIIIVKELQYTKYNTKYFSFKTSKGVIWMHNRCMLHKNNLIILKLLAEECNLDITSMKKDEIIDHLNNYIIFLE
jgi:folate-binding Fe-S cluster repair protein YgfZ